MIPFASSHRRDQANHVSSSDDQGLEKVYQYASGMYPSQGSSRLGHLNIGSSDVGISGDVKQPAIFGAHDQRISNDGHEQEVIFGGSSSPSYVPITTQVRSSSAAPSQYSAPASRPGTAALSDVYESTGPSEPPSRQSTTTGNSWSFTASGYRVFSTGVPKMKESIGRMLPHSRRNNLHAPMGDRPLAGKGDGDMGEKAISRTMLLASRDDALEDPCQ